MENKFKIFIALLNFAIVLHGQEKFNNSWTSMAQAVNIEEYQGADFILSGLLRKNPGNKMGQSSIWARVDTEDGTDGFFSNPYDEFKVGDSWETFKISGRIDKGGKQLVVGIFCANNGTFYFDDIKLKIKTKENSWKEIPLLNPSFEEEPEEKGIWGDLYASLVKQFSISINKDKTDPKNKVLEIVGSGVPGANNEKGNYAEINGVKIYYEVYGEGDPLVLLHGAGQSIGGFINQIDEFSESFKVIAIDSRGRGNSTDNKDILTYVNQAKDVKDLLDVLKIESVNIVGWSDGGIIGLILAKDHPLKVKKLVAMGANIFPNGLLDERLESHKKTLEEMKSNSTNPNSINFKLYNLLSNYPKMDYPDLKLIKSPTLIMAGDHDVIKDEHTIKMFQSIPNAHLAILPGTTHWFPSEDPKLFNKLVLDFLKEEFNKPDRY